MADVQKSIKVTANGDSSNAIRALKEMSTELGRQKKTFDDLRKSLDPAFASAEKFRQIQKQVADAVDKGAARQEIANKVLDEARRKYLGVVPAAEKAAQAAQDQARVNKELKSSFDQTRASLDPVFNASKRYETVLEQTNTALRAGVVSQKEANRVLDLAEQQYLGAAGAANVMGRSMKASSAHTTNLMFQFQDIGMMLAAGQSPLMLAMQQGTQVSGVFQQMRNSGQSAFKGIIGGLTAMVSPMSIATIGVIAGGAALAQWGMSAIDAGKEADALSERMNALRERSEALNLELRQLRLGVSEDELTLMDAITSKRAEIAAIEDKIANSRSGHLTAASGQLEKEKQSLSAMQEQLATLRRQQAEKERLLNTARQLAEQERLVGEGMKKTGEQTAETNRMAEMLKAGISATVLEAMQLAGVDMKSPVDAAAISAGILATNLGIAYDQAVKIQALGQTRPQMRPMDLGPDLSGSGTRPQMRPMDLGAPPVSRGGGGGAATVDPNAARIEALVQSLKSEREVLEEWRTEGLELLNEANAKELEALGGHNDAKLRLEKEYQDRLQDLKNDEKNAHLETMKDIFSSGAQLMQSGNKKLFEIGKAFAIANATVAGIEAAQHAWAKGMAAGGPPLAAAFAGLSVANTAARISALRSAGSGGGAGAGGSFAGAGAGSQAAPPRPQQNTTITLVGDVFSGDRVADLLNEFADRGGRLQENIIVRRA